MNADEINAKLVQLLVVDEPRHFADAAELIESVVKERDEAVALLRRWVGKFNVYTGQLELLDKQTKDLLAKIDGK
jgi:hypothetical protein